MRVNDSHDYRRWTKHSAHIRHVNLSWLSARQKRAYVVSVQLTLLLYNSWMQHYVTSHVLIIIIEQWQSLSDAVHVLPRLVAQLERHSRCALQLDGSICQ